MKKAYCTIITLDYLSYALALNESLLAFDEEVLFKILITDMRIDLTKICSRHPNIEFFFPYQLCQREIGRVIFEKYALNRMDCFRWSMKPIFINFLLDQQYEQVFFLDSDLFFFAQFDFLSDNLANNAVLLTPHWRSSNPMVDETNFLILQTSGLFNAGFIGVSQNGKAAMTWWARACAYKCRKSPELGLFDDQAYLDLMPVYFDKIVIEKHRGCNVANWNQIECERVLSEDGKVRINDKFEIVFIHFTKSTIDGIRSGRDLLLKPYLDKYLASLARCEKWIRRSAIPSSLPVYPSAQKDFCDTSVPPTSHYIRSGSDLFLNPTLSPGSLDKFIIRFSILNALKAIAGKFEGVLLDVGCGQMPYKPLLTSHASRVTDYIGLDFENNPIHKNQPDITWKNGKIPLNADSVDCAIATEVLEHCPEPEKVLSEIARVLKPGGLFFFTVPFFWPLHEVPYDYYRYTPFALKRHLSASGFVNIEVKSTGGWDASLGQMIGLWVRRRKMGKLKKKLLSLVFMPLVKWLFHNDKKGPLHFTENTMITGLHGIARTPVRR